MSDKPKTSRSIPSAWGRLIWPLLALAGLLAFNFFATPGFLQVEVKNGHLYGSVIDVLNQASPVLLVSLGMTLVIATGGVDLSVGAVMAMAGALAATLIVQRHLGMVPVVALTLGMGLLLGLWNGGLVAWAGVQPIVATLILMVAGRGMAQLLSGGQILTVDPPWFGFINGGHVAGLPFSVLLVAVMLLITLALVRGTAMGLLIEAVGNNEVASRLAGVNARGVKFFAYFFCGLCAALAGLVEASKIRAADANNAGLYLELDAILAVVIGGTALTGGRFSLIGSIIGGLIIQTLTTTILTRGVPVQYTLLVKALVIMAVFLLQSDRFRQLFARAKTL